MQQSMALHGPLYYGAVLANGVPVINEGSFRNIQTKGGIVSLNNVVTGATPAIAYFGCMMTINGAGDDAAFYVGLPVGTYTLIGPLLNEQGIRENDPAKPTYIMNEQPCTVVSRGRLYYGTWGTNFVASLAVPVVGCRIVYRWVTLAAAEYAGQIGFLAAAGAVPGTHTQVQGAVLNLTFTGLVDIDFFTPVAT
jgi:hypothetical protein